MTREAASADTLAFKDYIGCGCEPPKPQEIHCYKWEYCVQFVGCFPGT
jgi:hypothetical protein